MVSSVYCFDLLLHNAFIQPNDSEPVCKYPEITEACKPKCEHAFEKYKVAFGVCF